MILYQLRCAKDHEFEAWFRDGASCDAQSRGGKIECPYCGSKKVSKAPMAPRLGKGAGKDDDPERRAHVVARQILEAVGKLRKHVEENYENVAERFAEEARRIHYGEAEERGIYGDATEADAADLDEEGIKFARIPWTSRKTN